MFPTSANCAHCGKEFLLDDILNNNIRVGNKYYCSLECEFLVNQKIRNIQHYQDLAITTRQYPMPRYEIAYPMLGLIGEIGEFLETFDSQFPEEATQTKELGDCFWYCAVLSHDLGIRFRDIQISNMTQTIQLLPRMCKLAEVVKKVIRDEKSKEEKIGEAKILIEQIMNDFNTIILLRFSQHDMLEIMKINVLKLLSRKERGTIKGDGDNR